MENTEDPFSKTNRPCDCGTMSMLLNDQGTGVKLTEINTFMQESQSGWSYCFYHCPGCGGRLPDSSKPIWYPKLTDEEKARLQGLVEGLTTAEEAIERLGPPDWDALTVQYNHPDTLLPICVSEHDVVDKPDWVYNEEMSMKIRNIEYYNLSEHADIFLIFNEGCEISVQILLKKLPPRHIETDRMK